MGERAAKRDQKREIALAHASCLAPGTPATPAARGHGECPCSRECTLHGECLLCVAYHGRKHALPRCER
jgi:hypothetical protein